MWQHKSKSYRITTKVDAADKCSLAAFQVALVFIPIIVMLVITSLNRIYVSVAAADVAADLRWCLRWCKSWRL